MNVLWLTNTSGLFGGKETLNSPYMGIGWEASLQKLFAGRKDVRLAIAFKVEDETRKKIEIDDFTYYPICTKKRSSIEKLKHYYGGYRRVDSSMPISRLKEILEDFTPDIIHVHGLENPLANILLHNLGNVPIVVSLQGLLLPCANAFFPEGINMHTFSFPFNISEHILRNGYKYAYNSICVRAEHERILWGKVQDVLGRTDWDKRMSKVYAPNASYYYGGEVLREAFYAHAGMYRVKEEIGQVQICSTISNTVYKGLDIILKTANELRVLGIDYVWNVIGIDEDCRLIKYFSKQLGIDANKLNINFCGVKSPEDIVDSLLQSDVYYHPSYIDNSPNSVCEAQMIGCPVIANNVGGVSSLMEHGKSGLLVPANSIADTVYYIRKLKNCVELRQELSTNAIAIAKERHNKRTIIESLIVAYNKIISSRKQ